MYNLRLVLSALLDRLRFVGGVNQLPPIAMTPISSESDPKTSSSADSIGRFSPDVFQV